tara:strand:- start:2632 stop:3474 length:843 start_codon:yes stop_codon:yes gene_type:complete
MKLAYLGPKGTFTYFAAEHFYGSLTNIELIEQQSLDQLFDALDSNTCDAIFCPYENSIEGSVNRVLDNLTAHQTGTIHDMISMPISQSILGLYDISIHDIEHIISMPVAIAQCYSFIKQHCPNAVIHHSSSTAGAVDMIHTLQLPTDKTVIIGPKEITRYFPIQVIQSNIQDERDNATQFCVIRPTINTNIDSNTHATLAFSTARDVPGSLLNVLKIFHDNNINLTKILSRPNKSDIGSYIFYVEFMVGQSSNTIAEVIESVQSNTLFFKHLGYYKVTND